MIHHQPSYMVDDSSYYGEDPNCYPMSYDNNNHQFDTDNFVVDYLTSPDCHMMSAPQQHPPPQHHDPQPVSYTHLTLPTNREV